MGETCESSSKGNKKSFYELYQVIILQYSAFKTFWCSKFGFITCCFVDENLAGKKYW